MISNISCVQPSSPWICRRHLRRPTGAVMAVAGSALNVPATILYIETSMCRYFDTQSSLFQCGMFDISNWSIQCYIQLNPIQLTSSPWTRKRHSDTIYRKVGISILRYFDTPNFRHDTDMISYNYSINSNSNSPLPLESARGTLRHSTGAVMAVEGSTVLSQVRKCDISARYDNQNCLIAPAHLFPLNLQATLRHDTSYNIIFNTIFIPGSLNPPLPPESAGDTWRARRGPW